MEWKFQNLNYIFVLNLIDGYGITWREGIVTVWIELVNLMKSLLRVPPKQVVL